jgi:hypothetical protein
MGKRVGRKEHEMPVVPKELKKEATAIQRVESKAMKPLAHFVESSHKASQHLKRRKIENWTQKSQKAEKSKLANPLLRAHITKKAA